MSTDAQHICRIIAFVLQKGGVGKTTSAFMVAMGLAMMGFRVCLIDMDGQANLTYTITGKLYERPEGTVYEALHPEIRKSLQELWGQSAHENLFIVPGSTWMANIGDVFPANDERGPFHLYDILQEITPFFHYIIVDTPPNLGFNTLNSIVATGNGGGLVVPTNLGPYAKIGMQQLATTVSTLNEAYNPAGLVFPMLGIIINMVRYPIPRQAQANLDEIKAAFGENLLFSQSVPMNSKVEESSSQQKPPYIFAPDAKGIQAYSQITKELLTRVQ